jgi:ubiquinone/menaquinone biosynthesis C-methylase UbiE
MEIKQSHFTDTEIITNSQSSEKWHKFVRRKEFELIASHFLPSRPRHALELGAGDGGQSEIISQYVDRLTCTELIAEGNIGFGGRFNTRTLPNVQFILCDATDLSRFESSTFDFVYSSNMLEHIHDVEKCLKECARVLRKDGLMIHVMPSRDWKIFNFIGAVLMGIPPAIHGVSATHFSEFRNFDESVWLLKIRSAGFAVVAMLRMPFYIGHGPKFIKLIRLGNKLRLKSSTAFICKRLAS